MTLTDFLNGIEIGIIVLSVLLFSLSIIAFRRTGLLRILFASAAFILFAIQLFLEYVTDPRYEWQQLCEERFGRAPRQVLGEWNTIAHVSEYEGRPGRRPLTYDEVQALFDAASIAANLNIDLWNYRPDHGRGIRRALDWLVPFATSKPAWTYPQITRFQPEKLAPLLRRAAIAYREAAYEKAIETLPRVGDERWELLYPKITDDR